MESYLGRVLGAHAGLLLSWGYPTPMSVTPTGYYLAFADPYLTETTGLDSRRESSEGRGSIRRLVCCSSPVDACTSMYAGIAHSDP
jgi:hypothetical protein